MAIGCMAIQPSKSISASEAKSVNRRFSLSNFFSAAEFSIRLFNKNTKISGFSVIILC